MRYSVPSYDCSFKGAVEARIRFSVGGRFSASC